jgi:pimeloyl-ACP methyl ester carboxylesterase
MFRMTRISIPSGVLRSARRCALAYRPPTEVAAALGVQVRVHVHSVMAPNARDVLAYCWTDPDTGEVCIAFPGTDDLADLWTDLDVVATRLQAGGGRVYVHEGVHALFRSLEPTLTPMLEAELSRTLQAQQQQQRQQQQQQQQRTIVIAGHSLGGALAQMAAAHYGGVCVDADVRCHTFGSPRTGNAAFTRWFASRVRENYRVFNTRDLVAMLPARPFWKHTSGTCIALDDLGGAHVVVCDTPWWRRLWNPVVTILEGFQHSPLAEHAMQAYITRIGAMPQAHEDRV